MPEKHLGRVGLYSLVQTSEGVKLWRKGKHLGTFANVDEANAEIAKRGGASLSQANKGKKG